MKSSNLRAGSAAESAAGDRSESAARAARVISLRRRAAKSQSAGRSFRIRRLLVSALTGVTALALMFSVPAGLGSGAAGSAPPGPRAAGALIQVTTTSQAVNGGDGVCSLREAIYSANFDRNIAIASTNPDTFVTTECAAGSGADTIVLPAGAVFVMSDFVSDAYNFMGPTATPIIFSEINIEANGSRIEHAPNDLFFRAFAVGDASVTLPGGAQASGTGDLTIRNAHIKGFTVRGGDGAGGGGGGMGAGGAVYVKGGTLTVEGSTFEANGAEGGDGSRNGSGAGGGGGGLSGDGGLAGGGISNTENGGSGGGGGGGSRGNGGRGRDATDTGSGGGGGGTVGNGRPGNVANTGGFRCGGEGGSVGITNFGGEDGDDGHCPGGGGGGGEGFPPIVGITAGDGGDGAYAGGGGGGGGDTGDGGDGGFGGGGGGAARLSVFIVDGVGGGGGFGGGGGAGNFAPVSGEPGDGGLFGGDADEDDGGGGAALGGAIFNDSGAVRVFNSTFTRNFAARGLGGGQGTSNPGQNGRDAGAAVFTLNGSLEIHNSTISRNETTGDLGGVVIVRAPIGSISAPPASFTLRNTIIANNGLNDGSGNFSNANGECAAVGLFSTVSTAGSGNLITQNAAASPCPGVAVTADPQLGPLQLNAPGLTPTMAINDNSPAFNAGDDAHCQPFDQRGVARPLAARCDIGAYEFGCPALACPADIVQANDPGQCGAVVNYQGPTADASCPVTVSHPPGSFFPVGATTVTWTRGSESCSFTVTVRDTERPAVTAPADIVANNDPGQCSATLDPGAATVSDNCSGATASGVRSDGLALNAPYPVGVTSITWTATDAAGNTSAAPAVQTVTVHDREPPSLTNPSASPDTLWPPNHKMRDVTVNYTAADNCPGVSCALSVTSNEPVNGTGDGDTAPDWEIRDSRRLRLRAERAGGGSGRVYTITVACTDLAGNTAARSTRVVVPHSVRR
jgi:CSLREA domain-containing protein